MPSERAPITQQQTFVFAVRMREIFAQQGSADEMRVSAMLDREPCNQARALRAFIACDFAGAISFAATPSSMQNNFA
jgi:hypothetical protein